MEKVDLAAVSRMREAKQQAAPIAEPVEAIVNPLLASEDISSGRAKVYFPCSSLVVSSHS